MRNGVLAVAGLAFLAALSWSASPAQAMPISAPALKHASDGIRLTETVHCWDECDYRPRYYRPYYRPYYRSYYRSSYYYDRPYYRPSYYDRPYYRPYYRSYYDDGPRYYRSEPWWTSGPYYGPPRRYFVGPFVYSY